MKTPINRICSLIIFSLIFLSTSLYSIDLNFKYYFVEDGLSSNTIFDIIQDSEGHMWIATENGLNRFNGYEFYSFRNIPRDTTSIINNYVYVLFEDANKTLWIGTERGVCTYNLEQKTFRRFDLKTKDGVLINDRIQKIFADEKGQIYISAARQGIFILNTDGVLSQYSFEEEKQKSSESIWVNCMYRDKENIIWVSVNNTEYQIYKLDLMNKKFVPAFPHLEKEDLRKLASHAMYEDTFGTLWMGSWNNGLYAIDKKKGIIGNYLNTENVDKILHIHSITEFQPGLLLIGSNDGLTSFRVSPTMGNKLESHVRDPKISNRFVYPIYKDREGGLWIGTYYGGINYASPNRNFFTSYDHDPYKNSIGGNVVSCFAEDRSGNLWIGTDDGGLNYFNVKTEKFENFKPNKMGNSLSYHNIHALCVDDDNLWIGTYTGGLNVMDLRTRRFKHYFSSESDTTSLFSNSIYALYRDSQKNIWVGTTAGINLYDRVTDKFVRIKQSDEMTVDILEAGNRIWFATIGHGLYSYDLTSKEWKNYRFDADDLSSLISDNVTCLHLDELQNLWVGTNSGLCKYNTEDDSFITIAANFPSNFISNIFSDYGYLWISTTNGLVRYEPNYGKTIHYTKGDGLLSDHFTIKSGLKTSTGRIYLGTAIGFNAFYPRQIVDNKYLPQIEISDFQLFYRKANMEEYMEEYSGGNKVLTLPHNKNAFSFEYTALSYFAPEKNEYAFYLEGFDEDWNYVGNVRRATYTNIPPGEYVFRVKASNNDGVWNDTGLTLKIKITPPLWWNAWSILIYFVIIVLILFRILKYWKDKEDRRHYYAIEKIKTEQEKEAYNSKINFFTTIAHEIRTPVSLIIGPLEQIGKKAGQLPEKIVKELKTIDHNSQRLLTLVNQLLDFRKIEQETIRISLSNENVYEFLLTIYSRFQPFIENKELKFIYTYDRTDFYTAIDTDNLTKVVSNLLSNASKYSKDYIELNLQADRGDGKFRITVIDNGAGIPKEEQENIFKPFYQVGKTPKSGTGIGLYLVKSIVEALEGEIILESGDGVEGLRFTICLPIVEGDDTSTILLPENKEQIFFEKREEAPVIGGDDEKQNLLIVEDNLEMQTFLERSLGETYNIFVANNGVEGLEVLGTKEVDAILSDIMMPEMDGIEFCNQVKNSPLWNHIPFILLTAKTNVASKIEALDIGADAYVEKPFSISHLEAQIRNLIESRKKLLKKFAETPFVSLKTIGKSEVDQEFLTSLHEIIEQNISNERFSIDQLASELNISNSGLFAKIKNLTSTTPNKLLLLVRLKKASELLLENNYRINEICYMVGFNNPSYFAKCFQKQYGVLPKDYRETQINSEEE